MAKKCIPGILCVENMTLFILFLLSISVGYLYWKQYASEKKTKGHLRVNHLSSPQSIIHTQIIDSQQQHPSQSQNLYIPPLNVIDVRGPPSPPQIIGVGLPVNIRTSTANTPYRQIGILTKNSNGKEPLILPLFGRNLLNGRDKWQYYTMSNSGGATFNAKLPISVNGRSCTGEYGCDNVSNGDTVYVEGYDDIFRATIYENATLNYIPL